jgi:hypothetical protein
VLFGPNFLKGQDDRSAQNPKEVPLSDYDDDDAAAMTRLCRLIHHQYDQRNISFYDFEAATTKSSAHRAQELLALAIVANKYGCAKMVRLIGRSMLFELGFTRFAVS